MPSIVNFYHWMLNDFVFYKYSFFGDLLGRTRAVSKPVLTVLQYWGGPLCSSHHAPAAPRLSRLDVVMDPITWSVYVSNGCSYLCFSWVVHFLIYRQVLYMCAQITTSENTGRRPLAFYDFLWVSTWPPLYCLTNSNDLCLPEFHLSLFTQKVFRVLLGFPFMMPPGNSLKKLFIWGSCRSQCVSHISGVIICHHQMSSILD